jgi:DNA-binding SARP family transcriptional activator
MDHLATTHDPVRPGRHGAPVLTARLLGRFVVTVDGHLVDTLSSRRTRNVLAYLLAHRRAAVPRDLLMDTFWPNATPDAARNCLHVALTGVRSALRICTPHPIVERSYDAYRIADAVEVWVDAEEIEARARTGRQAERSGNLEAAVASYEAASQLYDGDFLADDPYTDWAAPIRDALRAQALEVQSRLIDLYAQRGDHGAALQLGRWVLTHDPCNEDVHRRLMSSYARTGRGHLALTQYHRCADALREAFGVAPTAETRALYDVLRSRPA